jgi:hypothetical protein
MALPSVGGGRQLGDGNLNEVVLASVPAPATFTADATVTAADLTSGIISCNKGSDAATALTLPLATALDTLLVNAKIGSAFDVVVLNVASGSSADVTVTTNTGWTLSGLMVVQNATSAAFRARKTGAGAWTLYAIS